MYVLYLPFLVFIQYIIFSIFCSQVLQKICVFFGLYFSVVIAFALTFHLMGQVSEELSLILVPINLCSCF